ncbi:hypothetical protein D9M73_288980 [compost metagenome]
MLQAFQAQHPGIETEVLVQIEMPGVVAEVAAHFAVVRVGRYIGIHGEFAELGGALRRDQMRRVVHGAVGIVDVP